MSDPYTDKPLDPQEMTPEALAALAKARRSFAISIGILILGFMAIAFALVYRVLRDRPPEAEIATITSLDLPAGSQVVSAVSADGHISVTYRSGADTVLKIFDAVTGEETGQVTLVTPAL